LELSQLTPPGQSVSPDVWAANVERGAKDWEIPLVALSSLGISHDSEGLGLIESDFLKPLTSGAEAHPFSDLENRVVYKLFDLRKNGGLGMKITLKLNPESEEEISSDVSNATLQDTIQKLAIFSEAGGHPTEIVGLDMSGHYLIAKQALAFPFSSFREDRSVAIDRMKGIGAKCRGLGIDAFVTWARDQAWLVGDVHQGNVMIDHEGKPTIIDALHCAIAPLYESRSRLLHESIAQAKALRLGTKYDPADSFENSSDEEL